MAHWVCRKNKYWSLEESYRDERGRPRKRVLRYLGIPPIDFAYTLKGDGAAFNEPPAAPAEPAPSTLPQGLTVGPIDPVPIEPERAPEPSPAEPSQPSEPGPDAEPSSSYGPS